MKLYSAPLSLFSRKVEIALAEKGLAFEREMVAFSQITGYAPKHPAVLAANPKGQVPVLVDGDLTLFDSTVIGEYLEDAYPAPPLFPREPKARARCRLYELSADEIMLPLVRRLMHRTEPPGPDTARRDAQETEAKRAESGILAHYGWLERELGERAFLCGEDFTIADIAYFMEVHWVLRLNGPKLDGHPGIGAWYARIAARPSVAAVVEEIAAADRSLSWPWAS